MVRKNTLLLEQHKIIVTKEMQKVSEAKGKQKKTYHIIDITKSSDLRFLSMQ